jgi:DNA-binding SARP family transcriptional activator
MGLEELRPAKVAFGSAAVTVNLTRARGTEMVSPATHALSSLHGAEVGRPTGPAELLLTRPMITLLGQFDVRWSDERFILPRASQRVVAFLGVHNRPLPRAFVAGTLWPSYSDHRSHANLRSALWRLRHPAQAILQPSRQVLQLRDDVVVDSRQLVHLAHRLLDPATACTPLELSASALNRLSCDLLPDWDDEWVVIEREHLRLLRIHALEALAERLVVGGKHRLAVEAAMIAVRAEPLQESANRALIRAHFVQGNVSLGIRQFERFRALLRSELGLDPSSQLRQLVEDVAKSY